MKLERVLIKMDNFLTAIEPHFTGKQTILTFIKIQAFWTLLWFVINSLSLILGGKP